MLHFEMFQDTTRLEDLTNPSDQAKYLYVPQRNYKRRSDLLDPTPYLDAWWWELKERQGRKMDLSMDMYDPPQAAQPKRAQLGNVWLRIPCPESLHHRTGF
jgi:hypothetical protein